MIYTLLLLELFFLIIFGFYLISEHKNISLVKKETHEDNFNIKKEIKYASKGNVLNKSYECAAGTDLRAYIKGDNGKEGSVIIPPGEMRMLKTGINMEIPDGCFGACYPRSGLGSKGIRLANCVGVIDSDYRGEIKIPLHNDSKDYFEVKHGDRICQLVIQPYVQNSWERTSRENLTETERGNGGFGSTGIK